MVNLHQNYVASMNSDFFQGQMYGGHSIDLTIPGKLGCPNKVKPNKPMLITAVMFYVWSSVFYLII